MSVSATRDSSLDGDEEDRQLYTPGAREFIDCLNGRMDPIMNPKDWIQSEKLCDDEEIDKGDWTKGRPSAHAVYAR